MNLGRKEKKGKGKKRNLCSIEIVDSEDRAPLVLVRHKGKPLGLACLLVPDQVHVDNLSKPEQ